MGAKVELKKLKNKKNKINMNAKKVLAIAAVGMMFSAAAFAQTTTIDQLMAQIAALTAQLNALKGTTGTTATTAGIPGGYQFTAPMRVGSTGIAVKYLQIFLNSNPATTVALSGSGSKGMETMTYGPATAAAVKKYQELNAAAILAPVGLTTGTGNFGASTMAHVNAALKATPVEDDFQFEDTTSNTDTNTASGTEEGTITATLWSSPADSTTIKGGQEKEVVGVKIKTQSGDVTLKRFDVEFSSKTFTKYAQDVALYDGSTELHRFEGVSATDLEELSSTSYRLRFPLNYKLDKNSTHYFYVRVKAKQIVSATNVNITVSANDIRGVDSTGLNQYAPSAILETTASDGHTRTFSFATEETAALEASNYPGAQDKVAQVSETGTTYDIEIGKINVKSKTVGSTLKTAAITVYAYTKAGATKSVDHVTNVAKLYDGETLLASAAITDANDDGTSGTVTFSDLSVAIAQDATKTLTVKVEVPQVVNTAAGPAQGDYVNFALAASGTGLTAEDTNLNSISTHSGSATSKYVHFYSYYPEIALTSATITKTAGVNGSSSDVAEGNIKFTVKAVGADIYVSSTVSTGVNAYCSSSTASESLALGSTATLSAGEYIVYSGETKTFTISDTITPSGDGYYDVLMDYFKWGTTTASTAFSWTTSTYSSFVSDWKTNKVYLDFRV